MDSNGAPPAAAPVPPPWVEGAPQAFAFNADLGRAAVQVHARGRFDLRDVVVDIPLAAVLNLAGSWLGIAAQLDLPAKVAPTFQALPGRESGAPLSISRGPRE